MTLRPQQTIADRLERRLIAPQSYAWPPIDRNGRGEPMTFASEIEI